MYLSRGWRETTLFCTRQVSAWSYTLFVFVCRRRNTVCLSYTEISELLFRRTQPFLFSLKMIKRSTKMIKNNTNLLTFLLVSCLELFKRTQIFRSLISSNSEEGIRENCQKVFRCAALESSIQSKCQQYSQRIIKDWYSADVMGLFWWAPETCRLNITNI